MAFNKNAWSDEQVERVVGNLLRAGVFLASLIVLSGGLLYLFHFGNTEADFYKFRALSPDLRDPGRVLGEALSFNSRALIQLGLLLLIATPVARVVFTVYAFFRQKDYTYVVITMIVLCILLFSLANLVPFRDS